VIDEDEEEKLIADSIETLLAKVTKIDRMNEAEEVGPFVRWIFHKI
jgi:hypothetical protein